MKRISKILNIKNLLTAAVVLLGITGCKDEIIVQDTDNAWKDAVEQRGEGMFHMAFRLKMASDGPTRAADGFVDGTDTEHEVKKLKFFFFNGSGEQLYSVDGSDITDLEHENKKDADKDDIEYEFNTLAIISLGDDTEKFEKEKEKIQSIESFIVIVNYDDDWEYSDNNGKLLLNQFKTLRADKAKVGDNFVMTTAGHYKDDGTYLHYEERGVDDKGEKVQWFFETKNAAKENPVTTYVERVAARVDLTIHENITGIPVFYGEISYDEDFMIKNQFGNDIYELKFEPLSWGVTAKGKETYLAKNLQNNKNDNEYYTTDKGYDGTNNAFYNWIRLSSYPYRVFWSESTYFDYGLYTKDGTEDETAEKDLSLEYLRYSALDPENSKFDKDNSFANETDIDDDGFIVKYGSKSEYLKERTFTADLLKNADNPNAIATSVVVYGTYDFEFKISDKVSQDGAHQQQPTGPEITKPNFNKGFYIRDVAMERVTMESIADEYEVKYRLYLRENTKGQDDLFNALLNEQYTIFKAVENHDGTIKYEAISAEDKLNIFEIKNTYQYWNGSTFVPSPNQYTLQLKPDWASNKNNETLYYGKYLDNKNQNHNTMVTLTSSNYAEANETIQKTIGAAQFYQNAHAFFYSPIPHYSITYNDDRKYDGTIHYQKDRDGTLVKDSNGKYIPNHLTGDLSVVRNHIYNLTVYSFSTLGYGQPEGDNLVLPEPRLGRGLEQFDIKLEIIPWNEFNYTFDL